MDANKVALLAMLAMLAEINKSPYGAERTPGIDSNGRCSYCNPTTEIAVYQHAEYCALGKLLRFYRAVVAQ